jgi:2,4-dienoyl-CoA reductase-like NADH-dependent reductase (Old Yellow Enzyme family)
MPLLVRIPGNDWVPGGWDVEQAAVLGKELAALGVDLIDVSSGGLMSTQKIESGPGYQAPFAEAVKKAVAGTGAYVSVVGMITEGTHAEEILQKGMADVVMAGRAFLQNPSLVWKWAEELGVEVRAANQIGWGFGQHPGHGIKVGRALTARG